MPSTLPQAELIRTGEYARKQLFGGPSLLRWSHGSRFRMGVEVVKPYAGRRLLDYGCGDGTYLALVNDLFPDAVGAEIDPRLVEAGAERFASLPGVSFVDPRELDAEPDGSFGVVVCMEVLEHCPDDQAHVVLSRIHRLAARDGLVVISVPIETGPVLIAKQLARALAGRRGVSGYEHRERYSFGELLKMIAPGEGTPLERPVYSAVTAPGTVSRWHGHKGFNWRALRRRVRERFTVHETRFSPLGFLGGAASSQAWLLCSPR
ncbi:MAG TPA: class I SAM-dependent methyltransferase [Longimicrobiaceae bacterium]|nr:class I SAM-dependent methyltransferase [Longimicrobiaceae bacterium]